MTYYVLEYDLNSSDPDEASILWETQSESLTESMKLATIRPGFEYEVVSEVQIMEIINELSDTDTDVPMLN